ncbi:MAG: sodium:solute symporter [Acidobacteriota bacterium]
MSVQLLNWAIVGAYFVITLWIGRRTAGRQTSLDDYLLAGRHIPWWAASLSIVATETSTLTFVGVPGIAYAGDLSFVQVAIGYLFGRAVVAVFLVPGYFRGQINTAYEVLAERFGGRVQTLASAVFVVNRWLADGVRLFATALVVLALMPMPLPVAIVLVAGVTLIYTLRGGLRAVIWNDVFQQFIYMAGAVMAAGILLWRIPGGWQGAVQQLSPAGKLVWLNFSWDLSVPYTFWAGLIGGAVLTAATHGTDQMFVQRLLACGSLRESRLALVGSGFVVLAQMAFFLWIGSLLFAFYALFPPSRPFASPDAVFPRFIAEQLPLGLGGLVIAAVFAAAMSTLSSSLNSLASATTVDFWERWRSDASRQPGPRSDATGKVAGERSPAFRASHRFTVVWALALAAVAGLARFWGPVLEAGLTITSVSFGGVLGIFVVGQTGWRLSEGKAALAMALGIGTLVGVHAVGGLAWTWYTLLGASVTVASSAVLTLWERRL